MPVEIRILVALEDDYRAYREVIAAGIRVSRPGAEVTASALDALEEELRRFDPHLVICSLPAVAGPGDRIGWVELPMHPTRGDLHPRTLLDAEPPYDEGAASGPR